MHSLVDSSLKFYMRDVRKCTYLSAEEEYALAKKYRDHNDIEAAHKLACSQLPLVVSIAKTYMRYGMSLSDLISEGNVGLMKAIKGFDPDKGFRFVTYAVWWIKESMYKYILNSWSITKIRLNGAQRKIFFNLSRLKSKFQVPYNILLTPDQVKQVADALKVPEKDIIELDIKMSSSDVYLDNEIIDGEGQTYQDLLADPSANQEIKLLEDTNKKSRNEFLEYAISQLNEREQFIIQERKLKEEPVCLQDLSKILKISRERVRQIEAKAFEKIQKIVLEMSKNTYEACTN